MDTPSPRRTRIRALWVVPILLLTAIDGLAERFGRSRLRVFTGPAVLLALLLWFSLSTRWQGQTLFFGLGLAASLASDLLFIPDHYTIPGLLALLAARIAYIIAFNPTSIPIQPESILIALIVWGASIVLFRRLTEGMKGRENALVMRYPMLLFSLAAAILLLSALATLTRPEWPLPAAGLAALGGLLLFASDVLLARDRFIEQQQHLPSLARLSFLLGQVAIVVAVLIRYQKL